MKTKNNKLGHKFFWVYLLLGSWGAFGIFSNAVESISRGVEGIELLPDMYDAVMSFMFLLITILFILAVKFSWAKLYRVAYYTHTVFLACFCIERILHAVAGCYYGNFYVLPAVLIHIGLLVLDFLYFKKRSNLQVY